MKNHFKLPSSYQQEENYGNNPTIQQRPNRNTETGSSGHGWEPGLEFVVEDTGDGIKLKPMTPYPETKAEELLGCVGYKGPKKSLREMEAAIAKGAGKKL